MSKYRDLKSLSSEKNDVRHRYLIFKYAVMLILFLLRQYGTAQLSFDSKERSRLSGNDKNRRSFEYKEWEIRGTLFESENLGLKEYEDHWHS